MGRKKGSNTDYASLDLDEIDVLVRKETRLVYGSQIDSIQRIPTGYSSIDGLLGGGVPRGRMTELYGPESSCKSLVLYAAIGRAQRAGDQALLVDMEGTFDPEWAARNGIDPDTLRIIQPESGDLAYQIIEKYLRSGKVGIIGVDSIAQMVPAAELAGEIGDANIGLAARLNAQAMRKLTGFVSQNQQTALVFINQTRANVAPGGYGPSETTTGGRTIPFYMSLRLRLRRIETLTKGDDVLGAKFRMEVRKAKLTGVRYGTKTDFVVDFSHGLDFSHDLLDQALESGLITKGGSWFTYHTEEGEEVKEQGEPSMKAVIRGDLEGWRSRILESYNAT